MAMCSLLLSASNVLKNRYLHVGWKEETAHSLPKQHIEQYIGAKNSLSARLETAKVNIKTQNNIITLYKTFGNEKIFGRGDVVSVLPITARPATDLIKKMQALGLLESVHGLGKGKYRFVVKDAD